VIGITFIIAALLPVYLYVLIGTGAITLTLLNLIGVLLISALCVSLLLAIAVMSKAVK
jgi:hypothetical protein